MTAAPHHQLLDALRKSALRELLPAELRSAGALLVLRELGEWQHLDPSTRQLEEATGQHRRRIQRYLELAVGCGLLDVQGEASPGGRGRSGHGRRFGLGLLARRFAAAISGDVASPLCDAPELETGDATSPVSSAPAPERGDVGSPVSTESGDERGDLGSPSPSPTDYGLPPLPPASGGISRSAGAKVAARVTRPSRASTQASLEAYARERGAPVESERIRLALRKGWSPAAIRKRVDELVGAPTVDDQAAGDPQASPAAPGPSTEALELWERCLENLRGLIGRHRIWSTWLRAGTWGYALEGERLVVGCSTDIRRRYLAEHLVWRELYAAALAAEGRPDTRIEFQTGVPGG